MVSTAISIGLNNIRLHASSLCSRQDALVGCCGSIRKSKNLATWNFVVRNLPPEWSKNTNENSPSSLALPQPSKFPPSQSKNLLTLQLTVLALIEPIRRSRRPWKNTKWKLRVEWTDPCDEPSYYANVLESRDTRFPSFHDMPFVCPQPRKKQSRWPFHCLQQTEHPLVQLTKTCEKIFKHIEPTVWYKRLCRWNICLKYSCFQHFIW